MWGQGTWTGARMDTTGQDYHKLGENYPSFLLSLKPSRLKKDKQSSEYNTNVSYENILDEESPSIMLSSNESVNLMRDQLIDKEVCFTLEISPSNFLSFRSPTEIDHWRTIRTKIHLRLLF